MTKRILLLSFIALCTFSVSAQNTETSTTTANNIAILITLIVALIALVLTVINSFRISHLKKVSEVNHTNIKDDINVTVEAIKGNLSKEMRGLKREIGKSSKPRNVNVRKPKTEENKEEAVADKESEDKKSIKRPYKKRNTNYRRRPSKKQEGTNTETTQAERVNE